MTQKVTVGDIIKFLEKFDYKTEIILDKDGWPVENNIDDIISYLIDNSPIINGHGNYLIINN